VSSNQEGIEEVKGMPDFKIATWNIEWMNRLFSGNLPKQDSTSQERFQQIKGAIENMDPDVLVIQEGPTEYQEMESFINAYLNGGYSCVRASKRDRNPVTGRSYPDTQMLWILCKKGSALTQVEVPNSEHNGPFQDWKQTIDPNIGVETFFHHRIPVEADIFYDDGSVKKGPIKIFGLHPKSKKAGNRAEAAENRRKLLAQGINIRNWIDYLLEINSGRHIVVCGDMNDGIGLDRFEYLLGGDFASLITGDVRKPHMVFKNALEDEILENLQNPGTHYTLKFGSEGPYERLLVDHILFSPGFKAGDITFVQGSGKIRSDLTRQFPRASDHTPVEAMIRIS
jgi:endonuclease/exonuclease/phosphatase family metal-dependent hydrolase